MRRKHMTTAILAVAALALTTTPAMAQPGTAPESAAADPITSELAQLTENYLQQRADMLTTTASIARTPQIAATRQMSTQMDADLTALAEKGRRYEQVDGGYTKATVDVEVTDVSASGSAATLQVSEYTRLYLPFTPQEVQEGAPEYEEVSLPHTVRFARTTEGTWLLASDVAETDGGPAPSTQVEGADPAPTDEGGSPDEDEGAKAPPSETTLLPDTGVAVVKPTSYNYGKIVSYADKYWKNNNKAYRTYGNDCTNFVSQAMLAGGWGPKGGALIQRTSNKYWFYGPTTFTTSYTWAGAENWYWFAQKHSKRTKILPSVWNLAASDVLQADWDKNGNIDHTMIVTKRYQGTPYLTYHTGATHNKSLAKLLSDHKKTWWYAHRT
ncbi:amidase domain-containing protein [Streptomyces sp. NPDC058439]|uniref:amidase domain-containing protein n=1 Tax=Streptomyces sp. NPDC058439 TaxID=3346500 RepID=UPI0036602554